MPEPESEVRWVLPESLEVPPDKLKVRLDFYGELIILSIFENGTTTTRMVSAHDIAMTMLRNIPLSSGLLPPSALWWGRSSGGPEVALWRPGRVWPVAIIGELDRPPVRMKLPMPGLIFICQPASAPRVFAAKDRPKTLNDPIYHAPLYNLFNDGRNCQGSHRFPSNIEEIPESFFTSFFTTTADSNGRSKSHPRNLMDLWKELDGRRKYPVSDLVRCGSVRDIIS